MEVKHPATVRAHRSSSHNGREQFDTLNLCDMHANGLIRMVAFLGVANQFYVTQLKPVEGLHECEFCLTDFQKVRDYSTFNDYLARARNERHDQ